MSLDRFNKRTKIVCTIGPASADKKTLEKMAKAGMNVARLNFSHGSYADHRKLMRNIRAVSRKLGRPIAILQDLQGPKVRVGELSKEGVSLKKNSEIILTTGATDSQNKIPVAYKNLHKDVGAGDTLLLDDGLLELKVKKIRGKDIICRVVVGGKLTSHKGINLPTASLSIPAITPKDKKDLKFGIANDVDFVALSFVKSGNDIKQLRRLIKKYEEELKIKKQISIKIIAKIEKHEAVKNFDKILEAADGIMVARGDLAIETPAEDVPLRQKEIVEKTRLAGKPVIVATQMLDSMIHNPRPTRAEISDVANAVIDHADAVMLSGESAAGKYPVGAVEIMAKTIKETEKSKYDDVPLECLESNIGRAQAVSNAAIILAHTIKAQLILVASFSGRTGRLISRHRPELRIVVATDSGRVKRQLNLSWGLTPIVLPKCKDIKEFTAKASVFIKKKRLIKKGTPIIVVASGEMGKSGNINLVGIQEVK